MSLQVSALADLEARIASLGGLLNSYSSGFSTPRSTSALLPGRSPLSSPESVRSPSVSPPRLMPPTPPAARQSRSPTSGLGDDGGFRWSEPARASVDRGRESGGAAAAAAAASGFRDGYGGKGWEREEERPASSSSIAASSHGYLEARTAAAAADGVAMGVSVSASDLAREVEALLQASGGEGSVGAISGTASRDASTDRFGDSEWTTGSGRQTGIAVSVSTGWEETKGIPEGWAELEGMTERLGALAGDSGTRRAEVPGSARVSVYGSSRGGGGRGV